jgi:hypothetical protein
MDGHISVTKIVSETIFDACRSKEKKIKPSETSKIGILKDAPISTSSKIHGFNKVLACHDHELWQDLLNMCTF